MPLLVCRGPITYAVHAAAGAQAVQCQDHSGITPLLRAALSLEYHMDIAASLQLNAMPSTCMMAGAQLGPVHSDTS